jgi:hypothetical protein
MSDPVGVRADGVEYGVKRPRVQGDEEAESCIGFGWKTLRSCVVFGRGHEKAVAGLFSLPDYTTAESVRGLFCGYVARRELSLQPVFGELVS